MAEQAPNIRKVGTASVCEISMELYRQPFSPEAVHTGMGSTGWQTPASIQPTVGLGVVFEDGCSWKNVIIIVQNANVHYMSGRVIGQCSQSQEVSFQCFVSVILGSCFGQRLGLLHS